MLALANHAMGIETPCPSVIFAFVETIRATRHTEIVASRSIGRLWRSTDRNSVGHVYRDARTIGRERSECSDSPQCSIDVSGAPELSAPFVVPATTWFTCRAPVLILNGRNGWRVLLGKWAATRSSERPRACPGIRINPKKGNRSWLDSPTNVCGKSGESERFFARSSFGSELT